MSGLAGERPALVYCSFPSAVALLVGFYARAGNTMGLAARGFLRLSPGSASLPHALVLHGIHMSIALQSHWVTALVGE